MSACTATRHRPGDPTGGYRTQRRDLHGHQRGLRWPPAAYLTWPPAGTSSWPWTTTGGDIRRPPPGRWAGRHPLRDRRRVTAPVSSAVSVIDRPGRLIASTSMNSHGSTCPGPSNGWCVVAQNVGETVDRPGGAPVPWSALCEREIGCPQTATSAEAPIDFAALPWRVTSNQGSEDTARLRGPCAGLSPGDGAHQAAAL
jgi:hypothetical protein